MGGAGCRYHLLICGVQLAVGNVIAHVTREQCGLLRYQGNVLAQLLEAHVANVLSVEQDAALLRVVETLQQLEHRGFTCP